MLGQIVFYTLSDLDRIHFGALREPVRPALVTEDFGDGTLMLHIFGPNPARPVLVRRVPVGEAGQPGTWAAAPQFLLTGLPPATVGQPYSHRFAATGTPAPTYRVSTGSLPAGLALNTATGVLAGTPTAAGSATFTVAASNGVGVDAVTGPLTLVLAEPVAP